MKKIPHIGLASGLGGGHSGSGQGPLLIQQECPECRWEAMIYPDPSISDKLDHVAHLNGQLAKATFLAAKENPSVVVVGGDHSCAVGTWSGIAEAKRLLGEDIALLWFDAHMDAHTTETSPSGNPHGMPLAALLGYGSPKLTNILSNLPKLKPENVFLIGIRSFEAEEKTLLEKLNVRIYYMDEVKRRGLKAVLVEILKNLSRRHIPYGISLDIDFFDPSHIPATGTPVNMGPDPEELIKNCPLLKFYPPIALELVEFNPSLDQEGRSLQYVKQILRVMTPLLCR